MTHPVHFQVQMPVGRRNRLLALLRPVLVGPGFSGPIRS
jgi:hypothetical protein